MIALLLTTKYSHVESVPGIPKIDIVIVNLYPFVDKAVENNLSIEKAIEFIDIGGPSMLRAAAKNHSSVIPICDITDYDKFIVEYDQYNGKIPIEIKKDYAIKIFNITSNYDYRISKYLDSFNQNKNNLPNNININVSASFLSTSIPVKQSSNVTTSLLSSGNKLAIFINVNPIASVTSSRTAIKIVLCLVY